MIFLWLFSDSLIWWTIKSQRSVLCLRCQTQTFFLSPLVQAPHPSAERRGSSDPQSNPHQLHVPAADQDRRMWVRTDARFKPHLSSLSQATYKDPRLHILWVFVTWSSTGNPNPHHVEHPSVGPRSVSITAEGSRSPVASWIPRNYGFGVTAVEAASRLLHLPEI